MKAPMRASGSYIGNRKATKETRTRLIYSRVKCTEPNGTESCGGTGFVSVLCQDGVIRNQMCDICGGNGTMLVRSTLVDRVKNWYA